MDRSRQHSTGQDRTAQHSTAQHSTAQHSTAQYKIENKKTEESEGFFGSVMSSLITSQILRISIKLLIKCSVVTYLASDVVIAALCCRYKLFIVEK